MNGYIHRLGRCTIWEVGNQVDVDYMQDLDNIEIYVDMVSGFVEKRFIVCEQCRKILD